MNKIFILTFFLFSLSLFAQEQELYKAKITNDNHKGFKVIPLTPNIRSIANSDLSDIRILDPEQLQVPYFLQEKKINILEKFISIKNKKSFGYKNISFGHKSTRYIINNKTKKLLDNLTLKVSNADVNKIFKIEGSHNSKKWFVVSEKINLALNNSTTRTYNYYNIKFPKIDYQYIKLTINDSLSAPINIKDIGYFNRTIIQKEDSYRTLDYKYTISQKEKSTIIHIQANRPFEINKLIFNITAPELYNRNASVYSIYRENKKEYKHSLSNFVLNSNHENTFKNLQLNKKSFFIEIDNQDNQPLEIKTINFYQKEKFLVSELKPNKTYTIVAGDKKLKKPSYDLVNFKDKIDTNLPTINIQNEEFYFPKSIKTKTQKAFYEQAWFLWISIGLVALIILYFTLSLIKQTKEI